MAEKAIAKPKCLKCGREAGADDWERVEHPTLGWMTQCPDCGSTDVSSRL